MNYYRILRTLSISLLLVGTLNERLQNEISVANFLVSLRKKTLIRGDVTVKVGVCTVQDKGDNVKN